VGLNVLQLLGWTAFELVIMRDGSAALLQRVGLGGAWAAPVLTLLWGALLMALAAGSMVGLVRRFVSRFGLPLVVLSLAWLSWQFGSRLAEQGLTAWWSRPGTGEMSALQALDLVIAMPVSWLPLVADYARYGRSARARCRASGWATSSPTCGATRWAWWWCPRRRPTPTCWPPCCWRRAV
jgi:NCS1 family nucleobase:cation symporter-1